MTKNTGTKCEGTQVFLTEILTTGSGRVTALGTSRQGVIAGTHLLVKDEVGFPDKETRFASVDAVNAGDDDLARGILQDVLSESEDVAWGDIAECYQVHVGCDCSPEQREIRISDLPAGCPECEMLAAWIWSSGYCEACGHESSEWIRS